MKKIALLLFILSSFIHPAVQIRTPVLAKVPAPTPESPNRYFWGEKELFEWGSTQKGHEVVTFCDNGGWLDNSCTQYEWCVQPIRYNGWHALKDYYIYILEYEGQQETLVVTGDQLFVTSFENHKTRRCPIWTSTETIFNQYSRGSSQELARFPENMNKSDSAWAKVIFMIHVTNSDNLEEEFFDVTIDDAHTYLIGSGHYWTHNMDIGLQAVWEFGAGAAGGAAAGFGGILGGILHSIFRPDRVKVQYDQWELDLPMMQKAGITTYTATDNGHIVFLKANEGSSDTPSIHGNNGGGSGRNGTDPDPERKSKLEPGHYSRKAIRSYDEQIEIHKKKIEDDRAGKNLPPNTPEHLREIIKQGQERHHLKEVEAAQKNKAAEIAKLIAQGLEP